VFRQEWADLGQQLHQAEAEDQQDKQAVPSNATDEASWSERPEQTEPAHATKKFDVRYGSVFDANHAA
jgi:hypothetical protein